MKVSHIFIFNILAILTGYTFTIAQKTEKVFNGNYVVL